MSAVAGTEAGQSTYNPSVVVVMAAYHSADVLSAAVTSILRQDYPNLRIGICAPAHDSATLAAARAIADPRIQVLEQMGKGIADARNLVLRSMHADLYMLLDADDTMMPDVVSAYVAHRRQTGEAGLRFGHYIEKISDGSRPEWVRRAPFLGRVPHAFERLCLLNFVGSGSVMFDRAIVDEVGVFDTRFDHAEDWHFWLRVARRYPLFGLDVVTYRYTYGKIAAEIPKPRNFFDDGVRVVEDVGAPPLLKVASTTCISAMYALYYFRTFGKRRTRAQIFDIRLRDLLSLPPAAAIRLLRQRGVI